MKNQKVKCRGCGRLFKRNQPKQVYCDFSCYKKHVLKKSGIERKAKKDFDSLRTIFSIGFLLFLGWLVLG